MTLTHDIETPTPLAGPDEPSAQMLLREAKRRERRRRLTWAALVIVMAVLAGTVTQLVRTGAAPRPLGTSAVSSHVSSSAAVVTCAGATRVRPVSLVITCADANVALTATKWTSWNANEAVGTTRFAMNLCVPYCAASPISYFANARVRLYAPVSTSHGRLFSAMVVHYTLKGHAKVFHFSWRGATYFR
jgi:hypothetical protein